VFEVVLALMTDKPSLSWTFLSLAHPQFSRHFLGSLVKPLSEASEGQILMDRLTGVQHSRDSCLPGDDVLYLEYDPFHSFMNVFQSFGNSPTCLIPAS
jgi:hypothetical protein